MAPKPKSATMKGKRPSAPNLQQRGSACIWMKPKAGRLKLNFDGSSKSTSASIGGVVRDHNGNFVLGYAESIGKATSSVAELAALRRGLELALENGWRDICVEGDFKTAVDAITSGARVRATKDLEQIKKIAEMLPRIGKASVSHVPRRGNSVADGFAELGHKGASRRRLWREVPPNEVLVRLRRDAKGEKKKKKKKKKEKRSDAKGHS